MKKLFIFACCLMLSFSLTGCGLKDKIAIAVEEGEKIQEAEEKGQRFISVYKSDNERILVDKETRVQYLYRGAGYGGGMTVLVDSDGKPLLYEGELE